ncbi:Uncharacterised protein [Vibrio cholerae]|nr:Uncharacterised protein [Vibrio cholerae]
MRATDRWPLLRWYVRLVDWSRLSGSGEWRYDRLGTQWR